MVGQLTTHFFEECMSKLPTQPLLFLEQPDMVATQVVRRALQIVDRRLPLKEVVVTTETIVPDVSDTAFNYGHIRITLGAAGFHYVTPLCKALGELANRPANRAATGEHALWFHGTMEDLAALDAEQLAKRMRTLQRRHANDAPYRGR